MILSLLPWTRFGFSGSKLFIWNILAKISPSSPGRIVRDLIWSYLTFCLSRDWYERFQDCPLNNIIVLGWAGDRKSSHSDIAGLLTGWRYKSKYAADLSLLLNALRTSYLELTIAGVAVGWKVMTSRVIITFRSLAKLRNYIFCMGISSGFLHEHALFHSHKCGG